MAGLQSKISNHCPSSMETNVGVEECEVMRGKFSGRVLDRVSGIMREKFPDQPLLQERKIMTEEFIDRVLAQAYINMREKFIDQVLHQVHKIVKKKFADHMLPKIFSRLELANIMQTPVYEILKELGSDLYLPAVCEAMREPVTLVWLPHLCVRMIEKLIDKLLPLVCKYFTEKHIDQVLLPRICEAMIEEELADLMLAGACEIVTRDFINDPTLPRLCEIRMEHYANIIRDDYQEWLNSWEAKEIDLNVPSEGTDHGYPETVSTAGVHSGEVALPSVPDTICPATQDLPDTESTDVAVRSNTVAEELAGVPAPIPALFAFDLNVALDKDE